MQIPPPILSDYDIEMFEAAQRNPEDWIDSIDNKSLATLCRYGATLAFLGFEKSALHSACELLESGRIADARALISFRAQALDLLLCNLQVYGSNAVSISADPETSPGMEMARLSMGLTGTPDAFDAFDKPNKEKTKCRSHQ